MHIRAISIILATTALLSCATDLRDQDGAETAAEQPPVQNTPDDGEATRTVINAASDEGWVYFDLESMTDVTPAAPEDAIDWDLAFQRFKIKSNGGVSGSADVGIALVTDVGWDALETAPSDGYQSDAEDGEDENAYPDYVFNSGDTWFAYDPSKHTLSPRDRIYVVRSTQSNHFKLQMLDYYDAAGSAGFPNFRWASVPAPED